MTSIFGCTGLGSLCDTSYSFVDFSRIKRCSETFNNRLKLFNTGRWISGEFLHSYTPKPVVQWRQIRTLCWPRAIRKPADNSLTKFFMQPFSCWYGGVHCSPILPPVFATGLVSDWSINLSTSLWKTFRWGINLTFVILNSFLKLRLTVEILRTDPNSRIIHISCSLLKGLLTRRLCTFDISFLIFSNVHMWETFRGFQKNKLQIFSC